MAAYLLYYLSIYLSIYADKKEGTHMRMHACNWQCDDSRRGVAVMSVNTVIFSLTLCIKSRQGSFTHEDMQFVVVIFAGCYLRIHFA